VETHHFGASFLSLLDLSKSEYNAGNVSRAFRRRYKWMLFDEIISLSGGKYSMDTAVRQLSRSYWWLLILRAVVAILFGILAIISPAFALLFLVYLFAAYVLIDGIFSVVVALQERTAYSRWWILLLGGIAGIILGAVTFIWPGVTSLVLFYLVAAWAVVTGLFEVIAAFSVRAAGVEWLLVLGGVLSIIIGIIFFLHPVASILTIVWLLGVFALVYGLILIVRAIQFRSLLTA
jgi:uncharacterized membrane protein HdeD (DUF308 family)